MTISTEAIDYLMHSGGVDTVMPIWHRVCGLLLSLVVLFAWCFTGEKAEECLCFSENTDFTAKQRGASKQQLLNSCFWAILVLGLPNAMNQLLGMLMRANYQNTGSEPGKRAIPCQWLPHAQRYLWNVEKKV